jgi:tetratricopeptide (TPR) repeat protein
MQIEVIDVRADREELDVLTMSSNERKELPYQTLLRVAKDLKDKGNDKFLNEDYEAAEALYKELYDCLLDMVPNTVEERDECRILTVKLYCNMALNYIKMKKYMLAFKYAEKGTQVRDLAKIHMGKPFYLCAKAKLLLEDVDEAHKYIKKAATYGHDSNVVALTKEIEGLVKKNHALEKERCERMLRGPPTPDELMVKKMNEINLRK